MPDTPGKIWSTLRADGTAEVLRESKSPLVSDVYHKLIALSWPRFFALYTVAFFAVNVLFGILFALIPRTQFEGLPGVEGPLYWLHCFFFSVQTFATIGYGRISPVGLTANLLVVSEAFVGLLTAAMAAGLLFARFSKPRSRVLFSNQILVTRHDGMPCVSFRLSNERFNQIVDAEAHVSIAKNGVTAEGHRFRYIHDLALKRDRQPLFSLTWTVLHPIDEKSPFFGESPESLREKLPTIIVTLTGIDETLSQTVHARHVYREQDILWNRRFADIVITGGPEGRYGLDLDRFHDTEPLCSEVPTPLTRGRR